MTRDANNTAEEKAWRGRWLGDERVRARDKSRDVFLVEYHIYDLSRQDIKGDKELSRCGARIDLFSGYSGDPAVITPRDKELEASLVTALPARAYNLQLYDN